MPAPFACRTPRAVGRARLSAPRSRGSSNHLPAKPAALQLPVALSLQLVASVRLHAAWTLPRLSRSGSPELLIVALARRLELFSYRVLLGDQLVLLGAIDERNEPVQLGGTHVEIARPERSQAVVDGPFGIDVDCALRDHVFHRRDGLLIKIRGDRVEC